MNIVIHFSLLTASCKNLNLNRTKLPSKFDVVVKTLAQYRVIISIFIIKIIQILVKAKINQCYN